MHLVKANPYERLRLFAMAALCDGTRRVPNSPWHRPEPSPSGIAPFVWERAIHVHKQAQTGKRTKEPKKNTPYHVMKHRKIYLRGWHSFEGRHRSSGSSPNQREWR